MMEIDWKNLGDLLKTIIPIVTFFLGLVLSPFVEMQKESVKAKFIKKNLDTEIKDELIWLEEELKRMEYSFRLIKKIEASIPTEPGPVKVIPRPVHLLFLKKAAEQAFLKYDERQRNAIKALITQVDYLNERRVEAIEGLTSPDFEIIKKFYKRYLYTGCAMLNTARIVTGSPKAIYSNKDQEVIEGIMRELGMTLTTDDLTTIVKYTAMPSRAPTE